MADPDIASNVSPFADRGTAFAGIWYYVKKIANGGITVSVGEVEVKNDVGNPIPTNLTTVASAAVQTGTGTSGGTLRVTTASDSPDVFPRTADNAPSTGNPDYVGGLAVAGSTYAPAYTAADRAALAFDKDSGGLLTHGRTLTTTDNVTNTPVASSLGSSAAYENDKQVKASAGRLFVVNGYNSLGSAQWIQVHNVASLPADGAAPVATITVAASSNFSMDFGPLGIPLSTGIYICNSTTGPTKTLGADNCYFTVSYT